MQRNVDTFMESCSGDKISCSAVPTALAGKSSLERSVLLAAEGAAAFVSERR